MSEKAVKCYIMQLPLLSNIYWLIHFKDFLKWLYSFYSLYSLYWLTHWENALSNEKRLRVVVSGKIK